MFLKGCTGFSDQTLIEMLNGSVHMQMFCGVLIDPERPLKDGKIVSAIRNRLAPYLDIKEIQQELFDKWGDQLNHLDTCLTDATCYESHLRYPTDVKLLWEACSWLHELMGSICRKQSRQPQPRNKYRDLERERLVYAKQRKPRKTATRKLVRRLIRLLEKMSGQLDSLLRQFRPLITLTPQQERRLMAIAEVLRQQRDHYEGKHVKGRIVSIDRPYIRPIVRGKDNKRVEFGRGCLR